MSEKNIRLTTGDYIELEDGRVRGPIGYACTEHGTARYSLHSCMDDDLKLGWWVFGVYADRDNRIDYDRPRDVKRVLTLEEVKAAVGSVHITIPSRGKMLPIEDPYGLRLEPVLMNASQRETVFQLIAERQAASEVTQIEPQPSGTKFESVSDAFQNWYARTKEPGIYRPYTFMKQSFEAGYDTALRNEIGQGIQPSEKAQGGLSGSERVPVAVTAAYRKGFEDAFGATSEGYNGEYPFQRKGIDFKTDDDWQRFYRAFLLDADLTAKPEPKLPPIPTPDELAEAMLKSIGKSLAGMGDTHKPLWTGMAKVAIEQLRGPSDQPRWDACPGKTYKPGNHPAHIEADMAREAAIEAAI